MPLSKLTLAGADWTVVYTDNIADLGRTDCDTLTIYINTKQTKQAQALTFRHELVHAIMFTMGERDHDERFVEGFSQLLYQYEKQAKGK